MGAGIFVRWRMAGPLATYPGRVPDGLPPQAGFGGGAPGRTGRRITCAGCSIA
jgi:hypothetical protein